MIARAEPAPAPQGPPRRLRERKKAQTREAIRREALRLFLEQGYERTTVDEIAAAANVAPVTFFRYFPTKDDVVLEDFQDDLITASIATQPAALPPLLRVQQGIRESLVLADPGVRDALLVRLRLAIDTPTLRGRLWDHLHATERLVARALAQGQAASPPDDLGTRVVAAAGVAALTTALLVWAEGGGERDLPRVLDEAFDLLRRRLA